MNPISSYWLHKRQTKARSLIKGSTILDVGSRSEKIREDAISLDIDRRVRPEVCASVSFLPFRDCSFDYITMLEVIEHLDDDQLPRALLDCKRVGSQIILSTPNCDSKIWDKIVWPLWSHTVGREWLGAHKQFFGKASLTSLLEERFSMEIVDRHFYRWSLLVKANTNPESNEKKGAPRTQKN